MSKPALSLIIAVYNKPHLLEYQFAALARQTFRDFEVIIADDGSGPEIAAVIDRERKRLKFPVTHIWHDDLGWRKNIMLNKAIRASAADWLVFTDADCLPSEHFLLDHHREREEKRALLGRRVETSERWANALTLEKVRSGEFERYGIDEWMDGFRGKSLRVEDGLRMPSKLVRTILMRNVRGMLGCNFSAAKQDMVAINGFDELYYGPGCGEDSDIQYRLELIGVTGKSMRNLAIQYHVWHPRTAVSDACWDRFQQVKATGNPRCVNGLEHPAP
jgi:glycosyltransferase involved in cell wall biosynthesis